MATVEHTQTGRPVVLSTRTLVGRATGADLVLPGGGVSGEHAVLFWDGARWWARDLGSRNGTWVNETRLQPGVARTLTAGDQIRFGDDQQWLLLDLDTPDLGTTASVTLAATKELQHGYAVISLALQLRVSGDQEFIEVVATVGANTFRLPPRAYHDLLLVLAKARLTDQTDRSDAEAGWLYFDDLCKMLGRSRQRVNVEVFRARQQLAQLGVVDAVDLFQRRPTTRQIRLGVPTLSVEAL